MEDRIRSRVDAERRALGSDKRVVEGKIIDLDRRIDNYIRAIGEGMEVARCKAAIADLNREKEAAERDAELVQNEGHFKASIEKNLVELRRFANLLKAKWDKVPFKVRRELILHFVEKIDVRDRRALDLHFKVPFDPEGVKFLADEVAMPHASTEQTGTSELGSIGKVPHCRSEGSPGAIPRAALVREVAVRSAEGTGWRDGRLQSVDGIPAWSQPTRDPRSSDISPPSQVFAYL